MRLLLSIIIIMIILSLMLSKEKNPLNRRFNMYFILSLILVSVLFYVNVSCDSNVRQLEPFRFEVSPRKSSYDSCCGKGFQGLSTQFQYTSDIDMDRRSCVVEQPQVESTLEQVPVESNVEQGIDYKDVNTDFVLEGYSDGGCGCSVN